MRVLIALIGFVALVAGAAPARADVDCPSSCPMTGCFEDPTETVVLGGDEWTGCWSVAGENLCYDGSDASECDDGECERLIRDNCEL